MAINRAQILKELRPGLHAVFGEEYDRFPEEWKMLFDSENSTMAWEEEVLFTDFGEASVKAEGGPVRYDTAGEAWVARYHHETIALAFALTEEAMEDNLYVPLSRRLTKALARSMKETKEVKGAAIYNRAFNASYVGGDNVALCSTSHPLKAGGTASNRPSVDADLSETALENAIIDIHGFVNDRNQKVKVMDRSLIIPRQLVFVAQRILKSQNRVGTADNDINALRSMGQIPEGAMVNHYLTDPDAWFIRTNAPDGLKHFNRVPVQNRMEGDFETGNVRYKTRARYSFGWSDWRAIYGSAGA